MMGKPVLQLPPGDDDGRILTGDINGDGKLELVVQKRALIDTWQAFGGNNGVRVATYQLEHPSRGVQVGDIDGDGVAELINNELGGLVAYKKVRNKVVRSEVAGWPAGFEPCFSADVDKDGVDEVIACHAQIADRTIYDGAGNIKPEYMPKSSNAGDMVAWNKQMTQPKGGIFYPKSAKFSEFKFPDADYTKNPFTGSPGELAVGDPDGDGKRQVFAMPSLGSMMLAFNGDGSVAHYEEFGQATLSLNIARAGKKDYLVVQLEKKLEIFP
jgi:hypothetical protein